MPDWPLLWALHYLFPFLIPQPARHCPRDTKMIIKNVEAALVHFQTEHTDRCPRSIDTFVEEKILTRRPLDAWGHRLQFICPGKHNPDSADIISAGRDGEFGDDDDVRSWEL